MSLSPEEKQKIYEEEKERIEARERIEKERQKAQGKTSTGLQPNIAGLLCYVLGWVTGIIFLILEQKNKWVRFHAAQSIIVFGTITIAGIILGWIPLVGNAFATIISIIGFILWIILMGKAYNGELYKLSWAGDFAEKIIEPSGIKIEYTKPSEPQAEPPESPRADSAKRFGEKIDNYFHNTRGGRITTSSFAIAWSIVLLVFFNFFHRYIAYYHSETSGGVTTWVRRPFFTEDINLWLPILTATLTATIIGHIILIILDRYTLREIITLILNALGLATVITLFSVFPFDFSVLPNKAAADAVYVIVTIVLIVISIGIGIGIIVKFIKLIIHTVKKGIS